MSTGNDSSGFWRLSHDHLAAALARRDLNGESLRVYLALADLTRGYGKERDSVSLSQIADRAGGLTRPHVCRALEILATKGLYGQTDALGQDVARWVVWPPTPVTNIGNTTTPVPSVGNTAVPSTGNRTVPGAVPGAGTHQDTKKHKKFSKKNAAGKPPPDSRVKSFLDFFCKTYADTVGRPYVVTGGKDGATVKRLLRTVSPEDLQRAARNMLADAWARDKADIGLLASKVNSWLGAPSTTPKRQGGFTPAGTSAADYSGLAKTFE